MKKIEIKTILGEVCFSWESEKNTVKETVEKFLKENLGTIIKNVDLSGKNLSNIDFSNSQFDNSQFYNSQFYNSKFYNSKFYNSQFYNSKFDNSKFYNSQFYNSKFYNSQFDNSQFDNSKFYNSKFYNSQFDNSKFDNSTFLSLKNSGALEPVRFDFFGRMLVLKNEVPALRKSLVDGKVNGSTYTGTCCCFMGTIANAANCQYTKLKGIQPDASSDTERWFMGIKEGDTPENSEIVKYTVEMIDEFLFFLTKQK